MMRGFVERGLIFDKDKGFFEKKTRQSSVLDRGLISK